MIDFEEELKKFHPSLEVDDAEDEIHNHDVSDILELIYASNAVKQEVRTTEQLQQ